MSKVRAMGTRLCLDNAVRRQRRPYSLRAFGL